MALVSLHNATVSYGGPPLLSDISLQIEKNQRICLMGRNGEGKTTLLKLIAGQITPDNGSVQVAAGVRISCFEQNIPQNLSGKAFTIICQGLGIVGDLIMQYRAAEKENSCPDKMQQTRDAMDAHEAWKGLDEIGKVCQQLQIDPEWVYNDLSGGLKRRVLLARALVSRPDLLMLDEPTNHLDVETIAWLEDFLLRLGVSILFVTHDRTLLRRLATRIVELDRGRVFDWECDYATFLLRRDEALAAQAKDWERFDRRLAQEEVWIRKGIKARRTRNEGRVRALKKMREERRMRRQHQGKVALQLNVAEDSGLDVIEAENISFSYPDNIIVDNFSLKIRRGDKIGIVGANGCGKTTLVRLLLGRLKPHSGSISHGTNLEVVYYDQMRDQLDLSATVRENVLATGDYVEAGGRQMHIFSYLQNFLFTPERAKTRVSVLSGGERNRVMLARLFCQPANLLVLDEPTNDLDLESLELLEELLVDFPGTVLLICHDRTFINNVVSSTIVFADNGEIREIVGSYDDWLEERRKSQTEAVDADCESGRVSRKRSENEDSVRKLNFKEKNELNALPEKIASAESEIEELQKQLSDPDFYRSGENVAEKTARLQMAEAELMQMLERWEELETRAHL